MIVETVKVFVIKHNDKIMSIPFYYSTLFYI